jgi:hypothetical protein
MDYVIELYMTDRPPRRRPAATFILDIYVSGKQTQCPPEQASMSVLELQYYHYMLVADRTRHPSSVS